VREFRAGFLRASGVPLTSGDAEGVQDGPGGAPAAAAIASSDDDAVTWEDVMGPDRVTPCGGEGFLVGGDRGMVPAAQRAGRGRLAAQRGGGAGAHPAGCGQPGPGSEMTGAGSRPEHRA